MKKTFLFLAICLAMTMAATSCGDFIDTSDNGDLDGYWQLSQVDTLANGVQVDMTSSKVFWGVQGKFLTMLDTRQAPCKQTISVAQTNFRMSKVWLRCFMLLQSVGVMPVRISCQTRC